MRKKTLIISAILFLLPIISFSSPKNCGGSIDSNQNSNDITVETVPHFRNELKREIELADRDGRLVSEQMYTYLDFKVDGKTYSAWWKSRTMPAPVGLFDNVRYRFVVRLTKDDPKCKIVSISQGQKLIWNNPAVPAQTFESPKHISLETQDGWAIAADLYGNGDRGVVLVHGGRLTKESWVKQARELEKLGFRVLSIDLRGFGQSKESPKTKASPDDTYQDVLAAVRYLRKSGTKTVSVVGGGMGGTAASEATVYSESGEINRIVLLGTAGTDKPEQAKGPKLFIATRDDANADGLRLPGIRKNYKRTPGPKKLVILKGSAHAQFVFETDQGERQMREILRFLSAQPKS